MNYQEIVQPIDFSSLYQLAFTLYAAFIVVEYAKSFTAQVINRFYNFKEEIQKRISEIIKLCKREELQNIESDDYFSNGEGLCLVDEYKRQLKNCDAKSKEITEELCDYIDKNTEYRIFCHISVFMMLYCFTLMMAGGFFSTFSYLMVHCLMTFTTLSAVFVVACWLDTKNHVITTWKRGQNMLWVLIVYFVFLILSFLSVLVKIPAAGDVKTCIWTIGVMVAVLLPYLNFIFFFLLITCRMRKIRKHCIAVCSTLTEDCKTAGEMMGKMLNHQETRRHIYELKNNTDTDEIMSPH